MDVDRTIEFLLEQSAKHDARIAQIEQLLTQGAKMLISNQEANRQTDKRISALVDAQMKTEENLHTLQEAQRKTDESLDRLQEAQRKTDESLRAFLDSMRGGNGKHGNGA